MLFLSTWEGYGEEVGNGSPRPAANRMFLLKSLLSGHLNVHSVLEGRHLLILVDRVDTDGERAPLPWVDTNTAARLRLQSGFVSYHRNLGMEAVLP